MREITCMFNTSDTTNILYNVVAYFNLLHTHFFIFFRKLRTIVVVTRYTETLTPNPLQTDNCYENVHLLMIH